MNTGELHSHNHDHDHDPAHRVAADADRRSLIFRRLGDTDDAESGWVYLADLEQSFGHKEDAHDDR